MFMVQISSNDIDNPFSDTWTRIFLKEQDANRYALWAMKTILKMNEENISNDFHTALQQENVKKAMIEFNTHFKIEEMSLNDPSNWVRFSICIYSPSLFSDAKTAMQVVSY